MVRGQPAGHNTHLGSVVVVQPTLGAEFPQLVPVEVHVQVILCAGGVVVEGAVAVAAGVISWRSH